LRDRDVDFCYGSCDGVLWPVLDAIFQLALRYDPSAEAVSQRQAFLRRNKLGICDIVESCRRERLDASDLGMRQIILRDLLVQLDLHSTIDTLIFTGGNSKNGPEYLFRRQLRGHGLQLHCVHPETPRQHRFVYADRVLTTISLTSPSNAANRAIGSSRLYKVRRKEDPAFTPFDFRFEQYKKVFVP
jgi:G:T/U-mismatch repair DNA glycosylase